MEISEPRLRSLLRQAKKVADSGKRSAAEQLYRQIVAEAPQSAAGWLGLANLTTDPAEKEAAYERALAIEPENEAAQVGLARLRGEPIPEPAAPQPPVELEPQPQPPASEPEPPKPQPMPTAVADAADAETEYDLVCYRHPNRETSLRCYSCGKPICSDCVVKTPVGYSCPDCIREKEDVFFNATGVDYLIAPLITLPLSLLAGWLAVRFSFGGFFIIFIMLFAGGAVGGFIGRITKRVIGNRRGRYLPHLVGGIVALGVIIWMVPTILISLIAGAGALFSLLGPGIYLFVAPGAAFYQMK